MTGIKMVAVHYKGGGPALIDLIAGRVSPAFTTILSVMPHIQAQRVRALAVSSWMRKFRRSESARFAQAYALPHSTRGRRSKTAGASD